MINEIKQAVMITLYVSAPMVLMTVLVGVLIGILQAVFQLQDQSLPFGIKVFGTVALLVTLGPWMGDLLIQFTNGLLDQVAYLGKK